MKSLCLVNASNPEGDNDYYFDFSNYSSYEDGKWRSWHSIPCAFGSEFIPYNSKKLTNCFNYDAVLVLVDRHFKKVVPLIKKLKLLKKKVLVGLHEGFSRFNADLSEFFEFIELANMADVYWNLNDPYHSFFDSILSTSVKSIPTVAPLSWNPSFVKSWSEKEGILVGTRTLNQSFHKRNTLFSITSALKQARKNNTFVSYINDDGPSVLPFLKKLGGDTLRVVPRKNMYRDWLEFVSSHLVVYQWDTSYCLGQIVYDCAITKTKLIGGNSTVLEYIVDDTNFSDLRDCEMDLSCFFSDRKGYPKFVYEGAVKACSLEWLKREVLKIL